MSTQGTLQAPSRAPGWDGIRGLLDEVRAEASEWGVNGRLSAAILLMPVLGGAAVAATRADRPLFDFLTREDSLLQWAQFAGFLAAGALGLAVALKLRAAGRRLAGRLYVIYALASVFVAGEEISWGQRIFGWGTPSAFEDVNKQHETTIHNVSHAIDIFNLGMLAIGLYGFLVPWILWRQRGRSEASWASWVRELAAPPLFLSTSFLWLFGYKLLRFAIFRTPSYTAVAYGEWAEFCLAVALVSFSALLLHRLRSERVGVS